MKILVSTALKFEQGKLLVLNQQALPQREEWLVCHTVADIHDIQDTDDRVFAEKMALSIAKRLVLERESMASIKDMSSLICIATCPAF